MESLPNIIMDNYKTLDAARQIAVFTILGVLLSVPGNYEAQGQPGYELHHNPENGELTHISIDVRDLLIGGIDTFQSGMYSGIAESETFTRSTIPLLAGVNFTGVEVTPGGIEGLFGGQLDGAKINIYIGRNNFEKWSLCPYAGACYDPVSNEIHIPTVNTNYLGDPNNPSLTEVLEWTYVDGGILAHEFMHLLQETFDAPYVEMVVNNGDTLVKELMFYSGSSFEISNMFERNIFTQTFESLVNGETTVIDYYKFHETLANLFAETMTVGKVDGSFTARVPGILMPLINNDQMDVWSDIFRDDITEFYTKLHEEGMYVAFQAFTNHLPSNYVEFVEQYINDPAIQAHESVFVEYLNFIIQNENIPDEVLPSVLYFSIRTGAIQSDRSGFTSKPRVMNQLYYYNPDAQQLEHRTLDGGIPEVLDYENLNHNLGSLDPDDPEFEPVEHERIKDFFRQESLTTQSPQERDTMLVDAIRFQRMVFTRFFGDDYFQIFREQSSFVKFSPLSNPNLVAIDAGIGVLSLPFEGNNPFTNGVALSVADRFGGDSISIDISNLLFDTIMYLEIGEAYVPISTFPEIHEWLEACEENLESANGVSVGPAIRNTYFALSQFNGNFPEQFTSSGLSLSRLNEIYGDQKGLDIFNAILSKYGES